MTSGRFGGGGGGGGGGGMCPFCPPLDPGLKWRGQPISVDSEFSRCERDKNMCVSGRSFINFVQWIKPKYH